MPKYNREKAKKIIETSERSIRIVRGLLSGKTPQDILTIDDPKYRTLVLYYQKILIK